MLQFILCRRTAVKIQHVSGNGPSFLVDMSLVQSVLLVSSAKVTPNKIEAEECKYSPSYEDIHVLRTVKQSQWRSVAQSAD